ncbi:sigma-70 family RNA polymerase sigma factor [Alteromonas sp. ASW11-19]|uniref:Sigma-70 family RNA polymerase sigma factor n=1 Tax=Alteromonas salexigens TaxID=2982530 RepID=A0ABT2VL63_9ALTE|nr:sigma-70 family RNA polymerase sigma factor [Alteromonas salexigens]MCU7553568.1 sigma-70 family RNA polymerase sigma factor [Alteromonas salexigens]
MKPDFATLFDQYGALLGRVASSYEANYALQQELLQEIALAVWQALARFKGDSSVKTYILKVAHNRAVSHVASQVRVPGTVAYDEQQDSAADMRWSPEHHTEQERMLTQMLEAVRTLPLPGRQVLTLSLEGLSYQEIAQICGLTTSHVGVLLKRARAAVTKHLENDHAN